MTTSYKAKQGKKLFGTGVLLFASRLIWFVDHPHPTFFRAEIVIGVTLAAYGMLVWRSAVRKLSLANYIIVLSCAPVLLLCVSKMSEWV
jgi:drug/metabolite transporter (DMT)-like permease